MSQAQRTTNTFQDAIEMDIDVHLQKKTTARYILGGRILFNMDRSAGAGNESGKSFSFATEDGNKLSFSGCAGFRCVGVADLDTECITMWTDGTNGQIRSFKVTDTGTVYDNWVLFDDRNDPNGDKFNFSTDVLLECRVEVENTFVRRVYFWDNRNLNQPRVVNVQLFYRKNTDGKYLPIHWNWNMDNPEAPVAIGTTAPACGASITYPHWMSVHSFDWNTDVIFPTIKFVSRLVDSQSLVYSSGPVLDEAIDKRCALKTGVYQYFVRYVSKDGYRTPVSPFTNHIFLSSMAKSAVNHHDYTMYASNVVTPFGIKLEVKDIDTRYDKMEVGYVFYLDKSNPSELTIFDIVDIVPGNTTATIYHVNHTGTPVSTDIVYERYETIMGINTAARKENKMYMGGITSIDDIRFNVENVTFKPHMRLMSADNTLEPEFEEVAPTPAGNIVDPATNSDIISEKTYTISKFSGVTEEYKVVSDYDNYKGMQYEHLFKGHWKGEIYGYSVVALDRKGNPLYAQHIKDFKFPEMYETGFDNTTGTTSATAFNHTKLNTTTGNYDLKIMGLMISGLRLPKDVIYDKYGKLQISGFMIVRSPRNKRIQHQGIILNAVYEQNCKADKDADDEPEITRPLPFLSNKFESGFFANNSNRYDHRGRCAKRDKICKLSSLSIGNRPNQFTYECPDLFVTGETLKFNPSDYIKLVGTTHKAYVNEIISYGHDQYYAKSYKTNNAKNRYPLGSESRIDDVWNFYSREQRKPYDKDQPELKFTNDIWGIYLYPMTESTGPFEAYHTKDCTGGGVAGTDCFPTTGTTGTLYLDVSTGLAYEWNGSAYVEKDLSDPELIYKPALFASGHANTTVLKCKDFMHLDIIESDSSRSSYHIVNFMKPNESYYADDSDASLEVRRYISTGHYQKIDASVLFQAKKVKKDGTVVAGSTAVAGEEIEFYQFDDIEIWGGDCFLQFVDFTRLMPYYYGACEKCGGMLLDYAVSHIIPLESNYNLMMRYGRTFAKSGTQAQAISCNNVDKHLSTGIMDRQQEDWNVNSALQHENNLQYYSSLPFNIKIVTDRKSTWIWSKKKTYSELSDSYRKVLRLNYYDLPGEQGEIVGSAEFFNNIYCWQESGFGGLRINERATVPTELEEEAVLGKGSDMDGINYISTIVGCQHRSSIIRMNNAVYWVDGRMGKVCRFAQDGNSLLSDGRNVHDLFTRVLPFFENPGLMKSASIVGVADYENNDVLFTLNNNSEQNSVQITMAYNESIDKVHYFHPGIPTIYMPFRKFIFAPNPGKQEDVYLYYHGTIGEFFGTIHKSKLIFVVNDVPNITKVFDSMLINVNKEASKRIGEVKITTQNQIHVLNLKNDSRAIYREDKLRFPMRKDEYVSDRVRGHYCIVEITIDNDDFLSDNENIKTIITSIDTIFRLSHKL